MQFPKYGSRYYRHYLQLKERSYYPMDTHRILDKKQLFYLLSPLRLLASSEIPNFYHICLFQRSVMTSM